MHVFPDLKALERKYSKELTVVGIHSNKFPQEGDTDAIRNAALRYGLEHPIANDNQKKIWDAYGAEAWPSYALIDPDGRMLGMLNGEGRFEILDLYISRVVKIFDEKKAIDRTRTIGTPEKRPDTDLFFPAKIITQSNPKRLFIADTNNHRILVTDVNGAVQQVIGSGKLGYKDGDLASAEFNMPHGMAVHGDTLYVADCENHVLRKIDLKDKKVSTLAGTGKQVWTRKGGPAATHPLNSPWDVLLSPDTNTLYIAMAGDHRIWFMDLVKNEVQILAGNGEEAIKDGPFEKTAYAQASGLALIGDILYVADSEGSAIRALDLKKKETTTVIGYPNVRNSLFKFGDADGAIGTALLQHVLAVIPYQGKLLIADTYNHKLKTVDPTALTSTTFLGTGKPGKADGPAASATFNEPGGIAILDNTLYVADTNNHVIRTVDLKSKVVGTLKVKVGKK